MLDWALNIPLDSQHVTHRPELENNYTRSSYLANCQAFILKTRNLQVAF